MYPLSGGTHQDMSTRTQFTARATTAREQAREQDGKFGLQRFETASNVDLEDTDWMVATGPEGDIAEDETSGPRRPAGFSADESRPFHQPARGGRPPSQWGAVANREVIAPGIEEVSCAGHGGVKLSPERNALVPSPLRSRDGWYEEDCEYNIPVATFPDAFRAGTNPFWSSKSREEVEDDALGRIREWFPSTYEEATGERVPAEESAVVREAEYAQTHENEFRVEYAQGQDSGYVRVGARRAKDGARTTFRMTKAEYRELQASAPKGVHGPAIDAENTQLDLEAISEHQQQEIHQERVHRERSEQARAQFWGNRESLTPAEQKRLSQWEAKHVRLRDGRVVPRRDSFENEPAFEVQQIIEGDRPKWYASLLPEKPGGPTFIREIPAVVAKAADVPDGTTDGTREGIQRLREDQKEERARRKLERDRYGW